MELGVKTTTIITMFFNMKKLKDSTELTRPFEFYINNCKPVLNLNYPMVIFCDEDTYEPIKQIRDTLINDNNTKYIIKNIEEYDYYQNCWSIINDNRVKHGQPKDRRNTSSYLLMGMFKPYAFHYVNQHNFFNTTHYAWIDIGCNHIVRELQTYAPKMLNNPNSKVTVCYIHYRGHNELVNMRQYMKDGGPCGIASTAYTIETSYVSKFYTSMFSILYEQLFNEVGHTDETVMTYCYDKYPEIFNIYGGDYGSVFVNYHKPSQDLNIIIHCFITNALKNNETTIAKNMARELLDNNSQLDTNTSNWLRSIS
jgi:hypothetical protein